MFRKTDLRSTDGGGNLAPLSAWSQACSGFVGSSRDNEACQPRDPEPLGWLVLGGGNQHGCKRMVQNRSQFLLPGQRNPETLDHRLWWRNLSRNVYRLAHDLLSYREFNSGGKEPPRRSRSLLDPSHRPTEREPLPPPPQPPPSNKSEKDPHGPPASSAPPHPPETALV